MSGSSLGALLSAALAVAPASPAAAPPPSTRGVEGPGSVSWPEQRAGEGLDTAESESASEADSTPRATATPPPPQAARPQSSEKVRVAVGLDPSAPGTKVERRHVGALMDSVAKSKAPATDVRRLRLGSPSAREVCRANRDDLVILVGYVAQRPEPVLLGYDCRLDVALAVRESSASAEVGLVGSFWAEHDALVRDGVQERRRWGRLGPKARIGIAAGVALVVVGVAIGLLVANALRDEVVVLKVAP